MHGGQHACPWSSPVNRSSSSQSDVISLFPALETGRMERGLVGSVKQGSCLLSFYFPIHKSGRVQPCDYQRDIRDRSHSWPCWSTLLVDICPARAVGGDAGRYHSATSHTEPPEHIRWMGCARLPASQQTNQAESVASPGSSAPASVVFISDIRGAMLRLCRGTGERAAFLCSL